MGPARPELATQVAQSPQSDDNRTPSMLNTTKCLTLVVNSLPYNVDVRDLSHADIDIWF